MPSSTSPYANNAMIAQYNALSYDQRNEYLYIDGKYKRIDIPADRTTAIETDSCAQQAYNHECNCVSKLRQLANFPAFRLGAAGVQSPVSMVKEEECLQGEEAKIADAAQKQHEQNLWEALEADDLAREAKWAAWVARNGQERNEGRAC